MTTDYEKMKALLDPERYWAWLRECPCSWCSAGPTEISHHNLTTLGPSGTSLKSSPWRAVNLCSDCHLTGNPNWHSHARLGSMSPEETRYWIARKTIDLLVEYLETVLNPEVF